MGNFNTYRSCLIPYESEIVALRRKRPPTPFSQIAKLLREKYQVSVNREAIFKFIKVRAKGYKPCQYAWDIELSDADNMRIDEMPSLRKTQSLQSPPPSVSAKPKTNREEQKDAIQIETDRAFEYPNPLPADVREDDILKRIQNIITKNGRFDYLSLRDVPISQYFFNKIDELGCKKDKDDRHYCIDPAIVLRIVKAVHTINETKGKKLLSEIIEAG